MVGAFHLVAFTQEAADVNALVFIARGGRPCARVVRVIRSFACKSQARTRLHVCACARKIPKMYW